LFLTRPSLGNYIATPEELAWRRGDVLKWVAEENSKLHIHKAYPLADPRRRIVILEGRHTTGKLLLIPVIQLSGT